MKRKAIAAVVFALAAGSIHGQSGGMKGMDMKKDAKGSVHKATGVVTMVDKDKVTIKHGPVQSMSWPAMSMTFTVKDKALLDKLAKDKKVDFEFVREGRDYVVTGVT